MLSTSPTLLERLRSPGDQAAWNRFVEVYTPLLFYWARRRGLQASDAADLVQEVLATLVQKLPEFEYAADRSFRNWLRTVTLNKWRDRLRKRTEQAIGGEEARVVDPEDSIADGCFEREEYQQYLHRRVLEIVRRDYSDSTWQACWLSITTDRSAADIGRELGLTEGAVYAAKCRILKRLREEMAGLED